MKASDIEEVLHHVYRMPIPLKGNPLKELNSYVFRGDDRNLLIDTGFRTEDCKRELLEGLALLDIDIHNTDILLTHLHADHSGNAPDVIAEGRKVYISEIDRDLLVGSQIENGLSSLHRIRVERLKKHGVDEDLISEMLKCTPSRTMAADTAFTDYSVLHDGDILKVGEYSLKAIHTPGHTPGQMCFEIENTGACILADHVLFDITPNITDWTGVEDSLGDYLDSLDKIDRYDITLPLPGHRMRGDFHKRIEALKKHHRARLDECVHVIEGLDHARLYDIAGHMTWKIRTDSWGTFPPAQRWFALGECLSHIDHLMKTDRIERYEVGGIYEYKVK